MTFLIIGLGSMGKRRIRNLRACGEKSVLGFDASPERRAAAEKEYGIKTVDGLEELPKGSFDAVIICTPPNAHGDYIRFAIRHGKHFFTEVGTSDEGFREAAEAGDTLVAAPSCTLRFFTPIKALKRLVDEGRIGKLLAWNYHVGQYLPDWHPFEDYREVFFSKKETGACRELFPFELSWLSWVAGSVPASVSGFSRKVSDLPIEAEDVLVANLTHENGVCGSLMIEALSRKPVRRLTLVGSEGVLEWNWRDWTILLYEAKTKKEEKITVPKEAPTKGYATQSEHMHEAEMGAFLDAIYGRAPFPYTFEEEGTNIKLLKKLTDSQ